MNTVKLLLSSGLLLSGIQSLVAYDVKTLTPFGKNPQEINKNIKLLAAQKVKIIDAINNHFAQQEFEIINKIKAKYKIPEANWLNTKKYFDGLIANDTLFTPLNRSITHGTNDHRLIKKAREIIVAYGMNPMAVTIENSAEFGTAGVLTTPTINNKLAHKMCLNIPELEMLSEEEFTGIIRHELTHLWYSDSLKFNVFFPLFASKFDPMTEPLVADFRKNAEMRADVIGTIRNTKNMQGLSSWFKRYTQYDQFANNSHPTFTERINALKQLSSYLNEAKKYPAIAV